MVEAYADAARRCVRAGLEAARVCAERGHHVTLLEATDQLGGQFRLASTLDSQPEFMRLLDWYATELARLDVGVRRSTRGAAGRPNPATLASQE